MQIADDTLPHAGQSAMGVTLVSDYPGLGTSQDRDVLNAKM